MYYIFHKFIIIITIIIIRDKIILLLFIIYDYYSFHYKLNNINNF